LHTHTHCANVAASYSLLTECILGFSFLYVTSWGIVCYDVFTRISHWKKILQKHWEQINAIDGALTENLNFS